MAKTTKKADAVAAKETEETKTVEVKAEEVKAEKKTAAKKAAAPKAEKKTAAKAAGVKMVLEYQGVQVSTDDIVAAVKAAAGKTKALEIYVKPEDGAAYYVADGAEGKVSF